MRNFLLGLSLSVMFIVGCLVGGSKAARDLIVPPVRAGTNPVRWEYQCVRWAKGNLTATSNKFGAQGWEMVGGVAYSYTVPVGRGIAESNVVTYWCFKRRL